MPLPNRLYLGIPRTSRLIHLEIEMLQSQNLRSSKNKEEEEEGKGLLFYTMMRRLSIRLSRRQAKETPSSNIQEQ